MRVKDSLVKVSYKGNNKMKWNKKFEDRRRFPRYYPNKNHRPKVSFVFNGGTKISIDTINISKGGLMGYTSSIEHFLGIEDQNIDLIEIIFPDKEPFRCTGRILRLQPSTSENKCFCAVEFGDFEAPDAIEAINSSETSNNSNKNEKQTIPDWEVIERVEQLENYCKIEDVDKEVEFRRQAYDSFDDITDRLTIEEKWWFYEMLDEMKRHEPNYPEDLKQAFLRLCRTGIRQSQNGEFKLEEE